MHEKRKVTTERIIEAANTFLKACEVDENDDEIRRRASVIGHRASARK